jgi:iron complex outermembrane receptor protein
VGTLVLVAPARAGDLTEALFLSEQPVVLTAARIQQSPLDAPAPVTVIDRQTIRASGFTEIQDLMRLVPGFQVADWYQGSPVVANHGMGSGFPNTVLVMLDGQSIVDPIKGSVDWTDLPIRVEDIERIEVVRGPNQASYGAGAYNGMINIITRAPGEDAGGVVSLSAGRHDFRDSYVRLGRRGTDTDWRVSASDRYLDTFEDVGGTLDNPHYRKKGWRQTLMASAVHRLDLEDEVDVNLGLSWGSDHLGSRMDDSYPYHDRGIQTQFFQVVWRANTAAAETTLRYSHYAHKQNEGIAIGTGLPAPLDTAFNAFDADTARDSLELQQVRNWSDALKGVWGANIQQNQVNSNHYFYGMGTVKGTDLEAFGNLDWRFAPAWLLHAGAMVEKRYNTDVLFSPRLALNYAITPKQSVRVSAGSGYRAPTMQESESMEMYDLNGRPVQLGLISPKPVRPEKVKFGELGYVGIFDELGLQVDGRVYAEHYSGYIDNYDCAMNGYIDYAAACPLTPPPGYLAVLPPYVAFMFENAGDIRVHGGELSLDWRHSFLGRFLVSYSVIHVATDGIPDPDTAIDISQSAPKRSLSLLWERPMPHRFRASIGYYHVGFMKWLNDGDLQPAYDRVDLRLAKRFGKSDRDDEIAVTLQALNGSHSEFRPESSPVRQAFVTLRMGW